MGDILGLTVSHFPYIRMKPFVMPNVLRGLLMRGWLDKPHLRDLSNWPQEMLDAWGDDQGETEGKKAQTRQVEQLKKARGALDAFNPDLVVMLYRDFGETFRPPERPKYWIHNHDGFDTKFYQIHGSRDNLFEEDPDRVDHITIHTDAANLLGKALQDNGLNPTYSEQPSQNPLQLGHNGVAGIFHLDWDNQEFKMPIVPIGFDPFGYDRTRVPEGLSIWDKSATPPLTPKEGFQMGRVLAQAIKASPYKVALVAATNWSNSQNTDSSRESLLPYRENDLKRFEQWKASKFGNWGDDWTHEEMEENAEWECLLSIVLAGAMNEVGGTVQYADIQTNSVLNSDWVTTVFDAR